MIPEEIFLMVAAFVAVMSFCILESQIIKRKELEAESEPAFRDDYREYETASLLNQVWHDSSAVAECSMCGGNDTPCIRITPTLYFRGRGILDDDYDYDYRKAVCKWCQELKNITYHLEQNGERRKKSFFDKTITSD